MRAWSWLAAATTASLLAATAGCGDRDGNQDGGTLTVWSLENQTDRVRATQAIADRFGAAHGVRVTIVAIDENQFSSQITAAAAAGRLPDVIGALPLAAVAQLAANDLLDTDAAAAVVDRLGAGTFTARALGLTAADGRQLAVPSDGWAQLLFYRRDLFAAAGLPAPDTYDRIRAAARKLDTAGVAGITLATAPDDAFTAQTFEDLALGNDCQLVDADRTVRLDSPQCVQTFQLYQDLLREHSVPGAQDVDTTRATYFSGGAAMVIWSSFLLDELAGLRDDALPTCPQCERDPAFLARTSGVVTAIGGPSGRPAQFGEITSWALTRDGARTEQAQRFVAYMMDEGYPGWLGIAPEGKVPARRGTTDQPTRFVDAWKTLPAGVDTRKPLGEIYPPEVLAALQRSLETFQRWGFPQRQGALVGATLGELPVPRAVDGLASGDTDAAGAARRAAADVRSIQKSLR